MKLLIAFILCLVASVFSREIIIRRTIEDDDSAQPNNVTTIQEQPQGRGNIFSDIFKKAAEITSKTAQGLGNFANGAIQETASFGEDVVNGAKNAISGALQKTGDVASKFANGVENVVENWWQHLGRK